MTEDTSHLTPESFVGHYTYHAEDKTFDYKPANLTLRADGKYVLVYLDNGHPATREEGRWQLVRDPDLNVVLDHSGFPVELKGGHIRLMINYDSGKWYEKAG